MSHLPENLVVITDGAYKGSIGLVTRHPGSATDQLNIGSVIIMKTSSQYRPLRLGDVVVL